MFELLKVFRDPPGKQNVSGVATIHHALRDVNSGAGDVGPFAYIDNSAHRTAVHTHAQLQLRMFLECSTNLQRAFHWGFWTLVENQRHPIPSRKLDQSVGLLRALKFLRVTNNLIQSLQHSTLVVNQQLRIPDNVNEEDMTYLQLDLFLGLGRHVPMRFIHILRCPVEQIKIDDTSPRG